MKMINARRAVVSDLPYINALIELAVLNWPMPNRVKRRAVPVLQYDETDQRFLEMHVATIKGEIVGVAAWDATLSESLPNGQGGLFHGLYVLPLIQGQGVGETLMEAVFEDARIREVSGLLIKAQRVSKCYFSHQGIPALTANNGEYPWQYWKELGNL
jgi:N-acetylglutamate synthase-like GNAT family acetyltransferase